MNNGLVYEAVESKTEANAWRAEAIDNEGDGAAYVAIFAGPDAKARAEEYAVWKNGQSAGRQLAALDA